MKESRFTVSENTPLAENTFRLALRGDVSAVTAPGQFVNLRLDGLFLRRPLSVCTVSGDILTVIYKVVGKGTQKLRRMRPGDGIDVMTGLGNGFDTTVSGGRPLLLGGGSGVSPMFMLAEKLAAEGKKPVAVLGFNTAAEVFGAEELKALGADVTIATLDGSLGIKGYVTDALPDGCTYYYACGPEPMLKAVYNTLALSGQLSFERRMGCGFGACMGCSCRTITGSKRICKEGPVMRKEEILWED